MIFEILMFGCLMAWAYSLFLCGKIAALSKYSNSRKKSDLFYVVGSFVVIALSYWAAVLL